MIWNISLQNEFIAINPEFFFYLFQK